MSQGRKLSKAKVNYRKHERKMFAKRDRHQAKKELRRSTPVAQQ